MRRSEYEAKLKSLTEEIEELKKVKIEEDGVWKPELYEEYWFIDDFGKVYKDTWDCSYADNIRFNIGNVFKTEQEAKNEVERRKVSTELKRFSRNFELYKNNYCIKYDMISKKIDVYNNYVFTTAELVFETEKDARDAIASVGEERILKYYLGIKEK